MCTLRKAALISCAVGVAVLLHGCGSGGGGGGDGTTTTTTSGTATTTFINKRSPPKSSAQVATELNALYMGFDETNDKSPLGVTLSMAANHSGYFGNQYCSLFYNPGLLKYTSCFNGQADCRMSAAIIGHKWMLDSKTGGVASFAGRKSGFIFDQTKVEQKWAKCAYLWDGASANNYNRGCGRGAPSNDCKKDTCAWHNSCSGHTCTKDDDEVKQAMCKEVPGGETEIPPTHDGHPQCFYPGAAFNFHGQPDFTPGKDWTRNMLKQRVKYNNGTGGAVPNTEMNNEIVIDEELLIPDYWEDPVAAITAFVYTKTDEAIAKQQATALRDDFCAYYACSANGGGPIPLVMIDDTQKVAGGPFVASDAETSLVV